MIQTNRLELAGALRDPLSLPAVRQRRLRRWYL